MSVPINMQIINNTLGEPLYVLVPYTDYIRASYDHEKNNDELFPSEVADLILRKKYSCLRAWREYFGLTQKEMAIRAEITQPAYNKLEKNINLTEKQKIKFAKLLGIHKGQLDLN